MLTFLLVWTVALGSLTILGAGMVFPELSRKNDLIWVGVGLFYALILWANSGNIGGGLLLGQTAGISLTVWLGWQMLTQRRELTAPDKKTPVPDWLQKIVDIVTPLWEKAYGLVAGQLGLDQSDDIQADTDNSMADLKSKVLGFLDKLNPQSAEVVTETSVSKDVENPEMSDEMLDAAEPEAVAVETVTVEDPSPASVESQSPADAPMARMDEPEEMPSTTEATTMGDSPLSENEQPMDGEMSGGSSEPSESAPDSAAAIDAPIEPEETPPVEVESVDIAEPAVDASDIDETPEPSEAELSEPESAEQVEIDEDSEAIAEDESHQPEEETSQEESNWPPEPTD